MDEAYFLSIETARNKALTAASHKCDTREIPPSIAKELAVASGGKITAMAGGVPIWFKGECIGGVGIGGASDEDDIAIARAGIHAVRGSVTKEESLAVLD
jgi:glc operon protein GlcG